MTPRRISASVLVCALAATANVGARAEEPPTPRQGCAADYVDVAGDAKNEAPPVPKEQWVTDTKLDVTDTYFGTHDRTAVFYFKMPNGDPATDDQNKSAGPRWDLSLGVKGVNKSISIVYAKPFATYAAQMPEFPQLYVSRKLQSNPQLTAKFDAATSSFVVTLDLDYLSGRLNAPIPDGAEFNTAYLITKWLALPVVDKPLLTATGSGDAPDDTAGTFDRQFDRIPSNGGAVTQLPLVVGKQGCFAPPPAKLANLTGTTVQYGDAAKLSAKLTDDTTGAPLAGRDVTFSIEGKSVTATTNGSGVATGSLAHGKAAGEYPLTVSFAGDDANDAISITDAKLKVVEEKTLFPAFKVAKKGTSRLVTVTLSDDDKHGVGSQTVLLYAGSTKMTKKTNSKGLAVFTVPAGKTVYAEFKKVAGKYLGAKSKSTKLA